MYFVLSGALTHPRLCIEPDASLFCLVLSFLVSYAENCKFKLLREPGAVQQEPRQPRKVHPPHARQAAAPCGPQEQGPDEAAAPQEGPSDILSSLLAALLLFVGLLLLKSLMHLLLLFLCQKVRTNACCCSCVHSCSCRRGAVSAGKVRRARRCAGSHQCLRPSPPLRMAVMAARLEDWLHFKR